MGRQGRGLSRAKAYFAMAESYSLAVSALVPDAEKVFAPYHMMIGHALELSLKAVIAATGRDEEWLTMSGHNLGHCYREARSVGFSGLADQNLAGLIDALDGPHRDQRFRYPGFSVGTPRLVAREAADTLRLHVNDVRTWLADPPLP